MQSLLGLFYNKINGSQEDIASESLSYILNRSKDARSVFGDIIKSETNISFSDLYWNIQNSGENLERPDMSGVDEEGKEAVLIEVKFWAGLTHNQPNGYLKRLSNNTVLVFLVPTLRERSVFEEVANRVKEEYEEVEIDAENRRIIIIATNQHVLFKSWNSVLNEIKLNSACKKDQNLISDINQIIGFCDTIDNNSFQPIMEKDLSQKIPRKINSYYDIVDKVVDELNIQEKCDINILYKTPQRYGYHRYYNTASLGFAICLRLDLWEKESNTPFWLLVQEIDSEKWVTTNEFKMKCKNIASQLGIDFVVQDDMVFFSLAPKLDEVEDHVVGDMAKQVILIHEKIES